MYRVWRAYGRHNYQRARRGGDSQGVEVECSRA